MKISTKQFDQLKQINPIANTRSEKKTIKYSLLKSIESVFGDKWDNLKPKTREAIDYVCMLSSERGFFFASPQHIAKKHGLAKSTVYEALKTLIDNNILLKINRHSRKHNGNGSPVHIFNMHPCSKEIYSIIGLEWKEEQNSDDDDNPTGSSDSEEKSVPTNNLTDYKSINNNLNIATQTKWYKYVPKSINYLFAGVIGENLVVLWKKVRLAFNKIKLFISKEDKLRISTKVLRYLYKHKRFSNMSLSEMCAYVYKSIMNYTYNEIGLLFVNEMQKDEEENWLYVRSDLTTVPTSYLSFSEGGKFREGSILSFDFYEDD